MTITAIGAALIFLCLWLQAEIRNRHKSIIIYDLDLRLDQWQAAFQEKNTEIVELRALLPIEFNPNKCGGSPVLRGTDFPVSRAIQEIIYEEKPLTKYAQDIGLNKRDLQQAISCIALCVALCRADGFPVEFARQVAKMFSSKLGTNG